MELMTEEKKNFKRTDIGLIPEDWEVVQLGDIINYTKGFAFKSAVYSDSGVRIVRVSDVKKGEIKKDGGVFIPHAHSCKYSSWSLNADDIIVSTVGSKPPLYESIVGKPYLVKESESGYLLNQNAVKLRVNNDFKYSQDLLYHHFEVRRYYEHIEEIFRGNANQASITLESLFKYKIPFPSTLSEQQAIAEALSDVDELIRSLDGLIQKKLAIKKGTMQQLLSGKKRLPGFDGEWTEVIMGKDASLKARIGWQGLRTDEYLDNGEYYLVTGTDFKNGRVDLKGCHYVEYDRYKQDTNIQLNEGDVLVTKDGTIGKVAMVEDLNKPATLNSGVFVIRPTTNKFVNEFLFYTLSSIHFTKFLDSLTAGSTINHLYQKDFVTYTFDVPSTIEEQKAIAQVLTDMDRELQTLRQKREKYVQIKQGMMQQLLTGRIRIYGMGG